MLAAFSCTIAYPDAGLLLLLFCVVQVVYDAADPVSAPLPNPWSSKLDAFQRLLLLRVLRPDKLTTAISEFVKQAMGARFVEPPPLDIDRCFKDSSATTPLIFVLSPGSDPMSMLLKYAEGLKVQVRMLITSHYIICSTQTGVNPPFGRTEGAVAYAHHTSSALACVRTFAHTVRPTNCNTHGCSCR
jgi:hypothetical protein